MINMQDTAPNAEFGELPPKRNPGRGPSAAWLAIAEQLRARPGEWAKVRTFPTRSTASTTASQMKNGRYTAFRPAGSFEAASRGCDVWLRYVGDPS